MFKFVLLVTLNVASDSQTVSGLISSGTNMVSIDWIQIALELFVTFLGFALAILGERITDQLKERSNIKELKKIVIEELKKVLDDLEKFNEEMLDIQPLKISSWESAINTGQISLFDIATRNKLFYVYNTIKEFNSWCLIHTNYYFEKGQQNRLLIKELTRIKNELLNNDSNNSSICDVIAILERR